MPKLLLDCDPGNDDALAILAAIGAPTPDLVAVTTGHGHLEAARTATNAATVMRASGRTDIPVASGATTPLVRSRLVAKLLDLQAGLDAPRADLPAVALDPRPAALLIGEIARAHPRLTIACTGPLTNLALALRLAPDILPYIARVIMLGGAWGLGNKTAAAEWNVLSDPEAAHIVFGAGMDVTMIPIDATAQIGIDPDLANEVAASGGAACALAGELLRSLAGQHRPGFLLPDHAPLNDPLAVLVAADAQLVETRPAHVGIELASGHSYGRTVIDFYGKSGLPANCTVVTGFDVAATRAAFLAALRRLARKDA